MKRGVARARLGVALATAAALLGASPAGAATWAGVTGPTSIIQEVGKVRAPGGTLHVIWTRATPGSSGTEDVLHVSISAGGVVGSPTPIAAQFTSASNPAIINAPFGGLRAFWGGILCTTACATGLFTSSSSDDGATWTTPTLVVNNADQAYASDVNAATLSDGTPFETWPHTTGVSVHRSLDPASPDYDFQGAMNAGCCGYQSNLAADGTGHIQLAWYSNATNFIGVWSRAVDPTSGAPSGSPQLMPGSVTSFNGAPSSSQMNGVRVPIVATAGGAGRFFVAYPAGYPTLSKVLLWQVGSASPVTVIDEPLEHSPVALATDSAGRLWVFWARQTLTGPHVFARREGFGGLEPVIDLGAPAGANAIYALDGDVSSTGDPEALALAGFASGAAGTYFIDGPQLAPPPPPQNGRAVDVSPVSGTVLVKLLHHKGFTRLVAGEQIPVGSTVDATHGRVTLVSAPSVKGGHQSADFYGGAFVISQHRGQALTTLRLSGGNFASCTPHHAGDLGGPVAHSARRRPRRHLWGSGRGRFRSSGRSASGTVRGTIWLTQDDCEGTLVEVKRGTVTVRDFARHKTINVHAGHSYFATRK